MILRFNNTYAKLPENFYQKIKPAKVSSPKLLYFNASIADQLDIKYNLKDSAEMAQIFSGNIMLEGAEPIALAYAGHQFGSFVYQLGDGRAILLGEIINKNNIKFDIQLKGSGVTPYSRGGDGRAFLGPVLREYIISQAMYNFGIKTTRSLAVVNTGEKILRAGELMPGAILTRIATSHIRVGTFEYFAFRKDAKSLKILADYIINRHYPEMKAHENPYLSLFKHILDSQIDLIVGWMRVGFIHGVMNTDNVSIIGETLDYGPCAFLDEYDPNKTFSSIDHNGRYRFLNQPRICQWNLMQLAKCFIFIVDDNPEKALNLLNSSILNFEPQYQVKYNSMMCKKIGISNVSIVALELLTELLDIMYAEALDYTLTFRYLTYTLYDRGFDYSKIYTPSISIQNWLKKWMNYLCNENLSLKKPMDMMLDSNPAIIPRNHFIEEAIKDSIKYENFIKADSILKALQDPYSVKNEKDNPAFMLSPKPGERVHQTFCGT